MNSQNFIPNKRTGTVAVSVTTSSQVIAIPNGGGIVYSFQNRGGGDAFVEFGTNNSVISTVPSGSNGGSTPVLANIATLPLISPQDTTHIALVGSANCTVYVTRGQVA